MADFENGFVYVDSGKKAAPAPAAKAPRGKLSITFSDTPNPNAMKFSLGGHVVSKEALSFAKRDDMHPLAQAMFAIPGVRTVFAVNDFVTVTKEDAANWANLTHPIVEALEEVI